MRASPPIAVVLSSCAAWRLALIGLSVLAIAGTAAWVVAGSNQHGLALVSVGSAACGAAVLAALSTTRVDPVQLAWNGLRWQASAPLGSEPAEGELVVSIDLGAWMLLRMVTGAGGRRRVLWLPVRRGVLSAQWHAFRCAVYAVQTGGAAP